MNSQMTVSAIANDNAKMKAKALVSAAAQRDDGNVLPLPGSLRGRGAT